MTRFTPATILVAEQNDALRRAIAENLTAEGHLLHTAVGESMARDCAANVALDLAIIDLNGSTLSFVDDWHDAFPIICTGQPDALDAARKLGRGAQDYMSKPLHYLELLARVERLLRNAQPARRTLTAGELRLDIDGRVATYRSQPVDLTRMEWRLLVVMATSPTRVFTKKELCQALGLRDTSSRTLDSHASRLRRKLADAGAQEMVLNIWGVGYRLTQLEFETAPATV